MDFEALAVTFVVSIFVIAVPAVIYTHWQLRFRRILTRTAVSPIASLKTGARARIQGRAVPQANRVENASFSGKSCIAHVLLIEGYIDGLTRRRAEIKVAKLSDFFIEDASGVALVQLGKDFNLTKIMPADRNTVILRNDQSGFAIGLTTEYVADVAPNAPIPETVAAILTKHRIARSQKGRPLRLVVREARIEVGSVITALGEVHFERVEGDIQPHAEHRMQTYRESPSGIAVLTRAKNSVLIVSNHERLTTER